MRGFPRAQSPSSVSLARSMTFNRRRPGDETGSDPAATNAAPAGPAAAGDQGRSGGHGRIRPVAVPVVRSLPSGS